MESLGLSKVVDWLWAIATAALTFGGKLMWDQISDMKNKLEQKADVKEFDRQRDNITKLFEQIREHEAEDRSRHEQLLVSMHENTNKILDVVRDGRRK